MKWRLFKHFLGGDDQGAEEIYRWHIAKRHASGFVDGEKLRGDATLDHYVGTARLLYESMAQSGFDPEHPVPIDPDMELLGGAHRVACALAWGSDVVVEHLPQKAWAPAWDLAWFRNAGMAPDELDRLMADWEAMCRSS